MGYAGFQENTDPNEIVIFEPQSLKVIRAFSADDPEVEL